MCSVGLLVIPPRKRESRSSIRQIERVYSSQNNNIINLFERFVRGYLWKETCVTEDDHVVVLFYAKACVYMFAHTVSSNTNPESFLLFNVFCTKGGSLLL